MRKTSQQKPPMPGSVSRLTSRVMRKKEQINRGDWLLADVPPEPFTRVIVELQTHTPLTQWQPLHIHHAASHVTGRVSLLGR
ncbi:selenocysteinyl-tRNA-specific translation factor [Escherichia coli]|uniref:Selenocysteinyl-tRNA-specific translation factor n=1 Tax=Escherichia coli TaxID=562 RepID=A0A376KKX5_ECOLX|nr:selenocysteinyl-tRNA-specific translation factor [Escherichia coli]